MEIQTVLTIILTLASTIITLLAVYAFVVLRDLRQTVKKLNAVLENVDGISEFLSNPSDAIFALVKGIISTVNLIQKKRR